jgi:hypothetical protein
MGGDSAAAGSGEAPREPGGVSDMSFSFPWFRPAALKELPALYRSLSRERFFFLLLRPSDQ